MRCSSPVCLRVVCACILTFCVLTYGSRQKVSSALDAGTTHSFDRGDGLHAQHAAFHTSIAHPRITGASHKSLLHASESTGDPDSAVDYAGSAGDDAAVDTGSAEDDSHSSSLGHESDDTTLPRQFLPHDDVHENGHSASSFNSAAVASSTRALSSLEMSKAAVAVPTKATAAPAKRHWHERFFRSLLRLVKVGHRCVITSFFRDRFFHSLNPDAAAWRNHRPLQHHAMLHALRNTTNLEKELAEYPKGSSLTLHMDQAPDSYTSWTAMAFAHFHKQMSRITKFIHTYRGHQRQTAIAVYLASSQAGRTQAFKCPPQQIHRSMLDTSYADAITVSTFYWGNHLVLCCSTDTRLERLSLSDISAQQQQTGLTHDDLESIIFNLVDESEAQLTQAEQSAAYDKQGTPRHMLRAPHMVESGNNVGTGTVRRLSEDPKATIQVVVTAPENTPEGASAVKQLKDEGVVQLQMPPKQKPSQRIPVWVVAATSGALFVVLIIVPIMMLAICWYEKRVATRHGNTQGKLDAYARWWHIGRHFHPHSYSQVSHTIAMKEMKMTHFSGDKPSLNGIKTEASYCAATIKMQSTALEKAETGRIKVMPGTGKDSFACVSSHDLDRQDHGNTLLGALHGKHSRGKSDVSELAFTPRVRDQLDAWVAEVEDEGKSMSRRSRSPFSSASCFLDDPSVFSDDESCTPTAKAPAYYRARLLRMESEQSLDISTLNEPSPTPLTPNQLQLWQSKMQASLSPSSPRQHPSVAAFGCFQPLGVDTNDPASIEKALSNIKSSALSPRITPVPEDAAPVVSLSASLDAPAVRTPPKQPSQPYNTATNSTGSDKGSKKKSPYEHYNAALSNTFRDQSKSNPARQLSQAFSQLSLSPTGTRRTSDISSGITSISENLHTYTSLAHESPTPSPRKPDVPGPATAANVMEVPISTSSFVGEGKSQGLGTFSLKGFFSGKSLWESKSSAAPPGLIVKPSSVVHLHAGPSGRPPLNPLQIPKGKDLHLGAKQQAHEDIIRQYKTSSDTFVADGVDVKVQVQRKKSTRQRERESQVVGIDRRPECTRQFGNNGAEGIPAGRQNRSDGQNGEGERRALGLQQGNVPTSLAGRDSNTSCADSVCSWQSVDLTGATSPFPRKASPVPSIYHGGTLSVSFSSQKLSELKSAADVKSIEPQPREGFVSLGSRSTSSMCSSDGTFIPDDPNTVYR